MDRRALLVGIDAYPGQSLSGCVADAERMGELLKAHADGTPNFECRFLLGRRGGGDEIRKAVLKKHIIDLLAEPAEVALLHFSGHGFATDLGGYLVTQDACSYDEGVSMQDLLALADASPAREVVILLDCCHAGALGQVDMKGGLHAVLREGVSLLTASGISELSLEVDGGGVFTSLVCAALSGQAGDLFGRVTVAGIYAHLDQSLSPWDQRPRFRINGRRLTVLRQVEAPIEASRLRKIPEYFASPRAVLPLDPSYEDDADTAPRNPEHERIFEELQQLARVGVVVPVDAAHMYDAAMNRKACKLSPLGQFCWELAKRGRI